MSPGPYKIIMVAYDQKICMASFTLNELRSFARTHNKQHNVKISQKKVPLHNDLKQKGVKMPKHKAYTGLGKFKQKKAVKKTVKKNMLVWNGTKYV